MRLVNKTRYRTLALRTLFCAVHRRLAKLEGRVEDRRWRRLRVEVLYARSRFGMRGLATVGGTWMRLSLPRPGQIISGSFHWTGELPVPPDTPHDDPRWAPNLREAPETWTVAALIAHELMHTYGYQHHQFYDHKPEWRGFTAGLPERLPEEATPARAPRDVVAERRARLEAQVARWERRAKLARTRLATLRRRLRGYAARAARAPVAASAT